MRAPATATVVVDDGTTIAYHGWEADPGLAADPVPVVLQHGFTADTRTDWQVPGTVAGLTATGRRVVGVDARGHGRSGKSPDAGRYGERRMAEDLLAVIDLLDLPVVDLVGYSMGAVVVLLAAASRATVRRLVVGGVGAGIVEVGGVDTRALPSDRLARAFLAEAPDDLPPGIARLRAHAGMLGADLPSLAAQARAVHREGIDLTAITADTLVIAGDTDPLAQRPHLLAEAIAGASLRMVTGGHDVVVGSREFRSAVIDFLSR
ncbi:alpha/beta fold hydrolase [Actinoplanes sp. N902-109]|uniref:alpha/beta fold hydrolase n=1 Tax=Actinoplanes sp. (strain N902-109) TaxID=649831 RepID=UPI00032948B3|nr:alpha/beta fold hydrolase [Actinoplanes sp. N902-109]AGL19063.1 lysophospholipase [Actinoplanes sp. N902-109]